MKKQDYILVGIVALFLIGSFFLTGKKDDKKDGLKHILKQN